jgi:hypothetical protein
MGERPWEQLVVLSILNIEEKVLENTQMTLLHALKSSDNQ